MGKVLAAVGSFIIARIFTDKVIIAILIKLGDYLVKKTTNKLDDEVWSEVRKALGATIERQ